MTRFGLVGQRLTSCVSGKAANFGVRSPGPVGTGLQPVQPSTDRLQTCPHEGVCRGDGETTAGGRAGYRPEGGNSTWNPSIELYASGCLTSPLPTKKNTCRVPLRSFTS